MNELEKDIMGIISSAGESRAKAFSAMQKIRISDYQAARELLEESREADIEAHNIQTKLIQSEISGEKDNPMSLLMVHAQDHYMSSQLARDIIGELVNIFEEKDRKDGE